MACLECSHQLFIDFKMLKIQKQKRHNDKLCGTVEAYLHGNANGMFLLVGLVCQKAPVRATLSLLKEATI
jgi:hypothetical protein